MVLCIVQYIIVFFDMFLSLFLFFYLAYWIMDQLIYNAMKPCKIIK